MIDWTAVATVFSVYCVGVVSPGPNFVAVSHRAAATTRSQALALVAGIVLVNLFWAASAILGIGIVFTAFPWVALLVKFTGAAYLIWFGWRLLTSTHPISTSETEEAQNNHLTQAFVQGIATNIANPKSVAFYAAVFSSAAPAQVNIGTLLAMLSVVGVIASIWYGSVAVVLSHAPFAAAYRAKKRWIDRTCGVLIMALGIRQGLSK